MVEQASLSEPAQPAVRRAIRVIETFAATHGEPVQLVSSHLGRAGSRIVLIGADGAMGDLVLSDPASLEALVNASPSAVAASWQNDTVAALQISPERRRKMAGR